LIGKVAFEKADVEDRFLGIGLFDSLDRLYFVKIRPTNSQ